MKKTSIYAVAKGRKIGLFSTWDECKEQVTGFASAKYKKFDNEKDAIAYIEENKPCIPVSQEPYVAEPYVAEPYVPDYYVYTDGACINNGRKNAMAGYGIYFGENDPRNISARILGEKQTNNVAELTAILKTYDIIQNDVASGKNVMIVSDSSYALRCVGDYGRRCHEQGWTKDVPNKDLVQKTYLLYRNCPNVRFMYIAAHTNHTDVHSVGNENADKLANQAIGLDMCPYQNSTLS